MKQCRERGFSLIELLIAISILAFGLLATASVLTTGIGSNRFAQMVTVETQLAYSVLDEIMSKDEGDPIFDADRTGVVYDLDSGSAAVTRSVQGIVYSATYSIDAANPVFGAARVDVTVSGGGRTISLTSVKRSI